MEVIIIKINKKTPMEMPKIRAEYKRGYTLIELILVITVLGILMLIAIPNFLSTTRNISGKEIVNNVRIVEYSIKMKETMSEADIAELLSLVEVPTSDIQEAYDNHRMFDKNGYAHVDQLEGHYDLSNTEVVKNISTNTDGIFVVKESKVYFIADNDINVEMDHYEDVVPPIITVDPYDTNPTNQDVIVCVSTNEGYLNEICHTFTENGSFEFIATDLGGNTTSQIVNIDFIDKIPPAITVMAYETNPTNQDIEVMATVDGGTFISASSHLFTNNDSFTFIAEDIVGNRAEKLVTITNIDKAPPVDPSIDVAISGGIGTITITYSGDSTTRLYKVDAGEWTNYSDPVELNHNATVYAKGVDPAGNESAVISADVNIDTTPPVVTFAVNGSATPKKSHGTTVTVTDSESDIDNSSLMFAWSTEITTPSSGWADFTNGATIDKSDGTGAYYLHIKAADVIGNEAVVRSSAFNIDNAGPTISLSPDGGAIPAKKYTVEMTATDGNPIVESKHAWNNTTTPPAEGSSLWNSFNSSETTSTPDYHGDKFLHIRAVDTAGNISEFTSNAYKVDLMPPVDPVVTPSTTTTTNQDVTVEIAYSLDASQKLYRIDGGSWVDYLGQLTIENNCIIEARALDVAGNASNTVSLSIDNIDKEAPNIIYAGDAPSDDYWTSRSVTIHTTDNKGIASNEYLWSTSESAPATGWTAFTSGATIDSPAGVTGRYYLYVRATDTAGNIKTLKHGAFELMNWFTINDTIDPGYLWITKYADSAPRDLIVPESIDGKPVIAVAEYSLMSKGLTSLTLPESIMEIRAYAFHDNDLTSVVIPDSVETIGSAAFANNKITNLSLGNGVTSLGTYAFRYNLLTDISIPDSLTRITAWAFSNNNLTDITIPSTVTHVEQEAFTHNNLEYIYFEGNPTLGTDAFRYNGLTNTSNGFAFVSAPLQGPWILDGDTWEQQFEFDIATGSITGYNTAGPKDVVIPEMIEGTIVKEVGYSAFNDIYTWGGYSATGYGITSIKIPETVEVIGDYAFISNPDIIFDVDANNTFLQVYENGLYTKDGKTLIAGTKQAANNILSGVEIVSNGAFEQMEINSTTLPETVTQIGNYAFYNNNLTSINIPDSVESIGDYAFKYNEIADATIGNGVTIVGKDSFRENKIETLTLGNSLTTIGSYAFYKNSIETLTIPDSVEFIGSGAFAENILSFIDIGTGANSIYYSSFYKNPNPSFSFTVDSNNQHFMSYGGGLYTKDGKTIVSGGQEAANNMLPGVETIDFYAFDGRGVTTVEIVNSVKTINGGAFRDNELTSVIIPSNVTSFSTSVFQYNKLTTITMPSSITSMGVYNFKNNGPDQNSGDIRDIKDTGPWTGTWKLNGTAWQKQ